MSTQTLAQPQGSALSGSFAMPATGFASATDMRDLHLGYAPVCVEASPSIARTEKPKNLRPVNGQQWASGRHMT